MSPETLARVRRRRWVPTIERTSCGCRTRWRGLSYRRDAVAGGRGHADSDDPAHRRPAPPGPSCRRRRSRGCRRTDQRPFAGPGGPGRRTRATHHGPGTGPASAGSRSCTGTSGPWPRRRVEPAGWGGARDHDLRPSVAFRLSCERGRRRGPGGASKDTTWPHAWTPASVRPGEREFDLGGADVAERRGRTPRRRCAGGRVATTKPRNPVP